MRRETLLADTAPAVLDASALVAVLAAEPGADTVEPLLRTDAEAEPGHDAAHVSAGHGHPAGPHPFFDPDAPTPAEALGSAWLLAIPIGLGVGLLLLGFWVFNRTAPAVAEEL